MFKSDRRGRASRLVDPAETQRTLLKFHEAANYGQDSSQVLHRQGNELKNKWSIIKCTTTIDCCIYTCLQKGTCLIYHNRSSAPALDVRHPVVVCARRGTIQQLRYTAFHWLPASLSPLSKNFQIFFSKSFLRFASEYTTPFVFIKGDAESAFINMW